MHGKGTGSTLVYCKTLLQKNIGYTVANTELRKKHQHSGLYRKEK